MTLAGEVRESLRRQPSDALLPLLRRGQGIEVIDVEEVAALGSDGAVAAARTVDGRRLHVPLVRDGEWRRAEAADGISARLQDADAPIIVDIREEPPALTGSQERSLAVDMTNDVRVIDDAVVAKWQLFGEAGSLAGPRVVAHLAANGFIDMPRPLATVTWHDELLASLSAYLPGAEDGWDWMLRDVADYLTGSADSPQWARDLGLVTARMHACSATPSHVISAPVSRGDLRPLAAHYRRLLDAIDGLDDDLHQALAPWGHRLEDAARVLAGAEDVELIPLHGDLHAGQFLRSPDTLVINDFDGNPLLPPEQRGAPGPTAHDVAGLLRSLDHVAIAAARRVEDPSALRRAREWAAQARDEALGAYASQDGVPALDMEILSALESLSPLHEAVYAATYLPRWRYVPLAVLAGGW